MSVPQPEVTVGAVNDLLEGRKSIVWYTPPGATSPADVWHLNGGLSPVLGAQEGVTASKWKGLMAPGKAITQQSARQDGDDWMDTVYDTLEIDFTADIFARTPERFRAIHGQWFDDWTMDVPGGRIDWFTTTRGQWWIPVRLGKELSDELTFSPGYMCSASYPWVARTEGIPFWRTFDSTDEFIPTASTASGFVKLQNRGNRKSFPRYVFQGPGTITVGDGLSGAVAKFGPLTAGQSVIIDTAPNRRSIREITTNANLYPKLTGRFNTPLDPVGDKPVVAAIPISITGATVGVSKVAASVTPYRNWPE